MMALLELALLTTHMTDDYGLYELSCFHMIPQTLRESSKHSTSIQ